ncbi:MAG: radical SAM protein [Acidimicrobiia bacterium]
MTYDVALVKVLLASTYELGHQPLHVASPAAALRAAGHEVRTVDLSIDRLTRRDLDWSEGVAFSVPMHTAMRLAVQAARGIRMSYPDLPLCAYGLYADFGPSMGESSIDVTIPGEYESVLLRWAESIGLERPFPSGPQPVELGKTGFRTPVRSGLPSLDRYAHLRVGDDHRRVGYVEASHGCRHRCRHCPLPAVYNGRIRLVDQDSVLNDIDQLVQMGAGHITFGDADFLNAPAHSMRVARAMHARHPDLTFDITTKVELIVRHASLWTELAASGLLFVVSAFETTNNQILALLEKGHTRADEEAAIEILRAERTEIRPTWLPFTPWTSREDLRDMVRFIEDFDLTGNVDPIQLTVRLLIPKGSLLLEVPELAPYLDGYDDEMLGWRWHSADPSMDALRVRLVERHEAGLAVGRGVDDLYTALAGEIMGLPDYSVVMAEGRPRLTEPWFC